MRRLGPALALLALSACDDPSPAAAPPDMTVAEVCPEPLAAGDGWTLWRCGASRLALRSAEGVELVELAPALAIDGEAVGAEDWPVVVWTGEADGGAMRWQDADRATMTLALRLDGRCVEATLTVSVAAPARIEGLRVLDGALGWPAAGAPFEIGPEAAPLLRPALLVDGAGALAVGGVDPAWPLAVTVDARVTAALVEPVVALTPEAPLAVPLTICAGAAGRPAWAAFRAQAAAGTAPAAAPLVGWRTGPLPAAALRAEAEALARWTAGSGVRPTVLVEGAWSAGRGDGRPEAGFAEGLRALPDGVQAAVVWPALAVAADGPVAAANPDWIDVDCEGDCPRLDPRIPAVRDHLAREALALAEQGLAIVVTGLPADPRAARALLASLPGVTTLDAAPADPPPGFGVTATAGLPAAAEVTERAALFTARSWMRPRIALDAGAVRLAGRPAGEARQAAALALLAGVRLLADPPTALGDGPPAAIARALLRAPALRDVQPEAFAAEAPPAVWRAENAWIVFNWSDAPLTVAAPPVAGTPLAEARALFPVEPPAEPLGALDAVTIAPGDAQVWVTVDEPAAAR